MLCTDPYVKDENCVPVQQVVRDADVLFVATPHQQYRELKLPGDKIVIDVWNHLPQRKPARQFANTATGSAL